jgi:hypothetical protein
MFKFKFNFVPLEARSVHGPGTARPGGQRAIAFAGLGRRRAGPVNVTANVTVQVVQRPACESIMAAMMSES